jgi:hypothetical protein
MKLTTVHGNSIERHERHDMMLATATAMADGCNATSVHVALSAASYNAVSATAFLLAPMLAYFCLCAARQGARPSGGFGKFMIVLELVDAVPEAAIIAGMSRQKKKKKKSAFCF